MILLCKTPASAIFSDWRANELSWTMRARMARPKKAESASRPRSGTGDELGAAELTRRVAEALKRYRRERDLSLDELASRSGVSRAALSQIETARTNPTLAVLWKVAVGLEVPFHDLIGPSTDKQVLVQRAGDSPPLRSADGRMTSVLLSPGGAGGDVEVYELRFLPKAVHRSDPHGKGTTETVVVLSGALRVTVGGEKHELATGDSMHFRADVEHAYENLSSRESRCIDVIRYQRS